MKKRTFGFIILILILITHIQSQSGGTDEYTVKASMAARFTTQIDWPQDENGDNESEPFVIAVIGKNPFGSKLDSISEKIKIKNRNVQTRYIAKVEEIVEAGCHLLFISKTSKKKLAEIVEFAGTKPILMIGDTKGYAEMGVHINILIKDGRLCFEVNRRAIRKSGLNINYHLLKLADRVIQ